MHKAGQIDKGLQAFLEQDDAKGLNSTANRVPSVAYPGSPATYYEQPGALGSPSGKFGLGEVLGELGDVAKGIGGGIGTAGKDMWHGLVGLGDAISSGVTDTAYTLFDDAITGLRGAGNAGYNFLTSGGRNMDADYGPMGDHLRPDIDRALDHVRAIPGGIDLAGRRLMAAPVNLYDSLVAGPFGLKLQSPEYSRQDNLDRKAFREWLYNDPRRPELGSLEDTAALGSELALGHMSKVPQAAVGFLSGVGTPQPYYGTHGDSLEEDVPESQWSPARIISGFFPGRVAANMAGYWPGNMIGREANRYADKAQQARISRDMVDPSTDIGKGVARDLDMYRLARLMHTDALRSLSKPEQDRLDAYKADPELAAYMSELGVTDDDLARADFARPGKLLDTYRLIDAIQDKINMDKIQSYADLAMMAPSVLHVLHGAAKPGATAIVR